MGTITSSTEDVPNKILKTLIEKCAKLLTEQNQVNILSPVIDMHSHDNNVYNKGVIDAMTLINEAMTAKQPFVVDDPIDFEASILDAATS